MKIKCILLAFVFVVNFAGGKGSKVSSALGLENPSTPDKPSLYEECSSQISENSRNGKIIYPENVLKLFEDNLSWLVQEANIDSEREWTAFLMIINYIYPEYIGSNASYYPNHFTKGCHKAFKNAGMQNFDTLSIIPTSLWKQMLNIVLSSLTKDNMVLYNVRKCLSEEVLDIHKKDSASNFEKFADEAEKITETELEKKTYYKTAAFVAFHHYEFKNTLKILANKEALLNTYNKVLLYVPDNQKLNSNLGSDEGRVSFVKDVVSQMKALDKMQDLSLPWLNVMLKYSSGS